MKKEKSLTKKEKIKLELANMFPPVGKDYEVWQRLNSQREKLKFLLNMGSKSNIKEQI